MKDFFTASQRASEKSDHGRPKRKGSYHYIIFNNSHRKLPDIPLDLEQKNTTLRQNEPVKKVITSERAKQATFISMNTFPTIFMIKKLQKNTIGFNRKNYVTGKRTSKKSAYE